MKKTFLYLAVMAALSGSMVSCSDSSDDVIEEIQSDYKFVEPYHVWGSTADQVATYMSDIKGYSLSNQTDYSISYTSSEAGMSMMYGMTIYGLNSAQATVPTKYKDKVVEKLAASYQQQTTGSESEGIYFFLPSDKSTSITTVITNSYFVINYVKVTK